MAPTKADLLLVVFFQQRHVSRRNSARAEPNYRVFELTGKIEGHLVHVVLVVGRACFLVAA